MDANWPPWWLDLFGDVPPEDEKRMFMIRKGRSGDTSVNLFNYNQHEFLAEEGLRQVGAYVQRMLASDVGDSWITILTANQERGFSLIRQDERLCMVFCVRQRVRTVDEARIREFFNSRDTPPLQDYFASGGSVHVLMYPVPMHAGELVTLCQRVLREVHSLDPQDNLHILASCSQERDVTE
jgi:hypothetical protein